MEGNIRIERPGKHCINKKTIFNNMFYTVLLIFLVALIVSSFFIFERNNKLRAEAEVARIQEEELAAKRAEEEAESAAHTEELQIIAAQRKTEIELLSKLFEGVRQFNYSVEDLMTLGWCAYNREDSSLYPNTLDEVIHQEKQWIAFSDDNPIINDYYRIAEKLVEERYSGNPRPCTTKFLWAVCDKYEVYLVDSVESGVRARTWRYSIA